MINRYRRAARSATGLGLGTLAPLDLAIPELRAFTDWPEKVANDRRADREPGEQPRDLVGGPRQT
jgi:hypothetical protein